MSSGASPAAATALWASLRPATTAGHGKAIRAKLADQKRRQHLFDLAAHAGNHFDPARVEQRLKRL